MPYQILADIVVLIHFAFIIFVILGGFLALRWRWLVWIHIPVVLWGVLIEFAGWICPLTPLENQFRMKSGASGYQSGFIEHYIIPIIYPTDLTRSLQIKLGILVILINASIYGFILYKKFKKVLPK
jgi:hypothetical protein